MRQQPALDVAKEALFGVMREAADPARTHHPMTRNHNRKVIRAASLTDSARHDPRFLRAGVCVAHDGTRLWLRAGNPNWLEQTGEVGLESETLLQLFTYAVQHNLLVRPQ